MKQRRALLILGIFVTVFFISCTGFFDLGQEEITSLGNSERPATTLIYFNNSNNNYAVDVYSSPARGAKITSLSAGSISNNIAWVPTPDNEGFLFYLTYILSVAGNDIELIPTKYGIHFTTVAIPRDQTTSVLIPQLDAMVGYNESPFDEAIISIRNNFPSGIRFLSGNGDLQPVSGSSLINNGRTALYRVNPTTTGISGFTIQVQSDRKALPSSITSFRGGYLYEIEVSSNGLVNISYGKPDNGTLLTLYHIATNR